MRRASSHGDPPPLAEKRRRSPRERKDLDYERQRRGFSEAQHSFRHGKWRKKRRAAHKPERQGAAQRLRALIGATAGGEDALADVTLPVRNRLAKWGATKLRDWVRGRLEGRADRFAWRLLKADYDTAAHREPFAAALRALTAGRRTAIAERIEVLLRIMDEGSMPKEPLRIWGARGAREARWLRSFFADEPA
ncbi:MAG TPA: hypothetical protein VLT33_26170, partial [Labilithrix sp.]|nr:hypothetical protein [Labilithrix sp.]